VSAATSDAPLRDDPIRSPSPEPDDYTNTEGNGKAPSMQKAGLIEQLHETF
jgi:hypothetical protein